MQKSELLRAIQNEIRRHHFDTFVDEPPSIAQGGRGIVTPGCVTCRKKLFTTPDYVNHLCNDVLPQVLSIRLEDFAECSRLGKIPIEELEQGRWTNLGAIAFLAFRHPELFGSLGAHSAALLEIVPAVTVSDSRQLARSRILGDVFGSPLDPVFWKQNDPLIIARTASLAGLQIYFDCGSEDDFGFDAGAVALDKMLGSRHIPHEFHLYPGGHNWVYVAEHLPALLQFHVRVFESASRRRNSVR